MAEFVTRGDQQVNSGGELVRKLGDPSLLVSVESSP